MREFAEDCTQTEYINKELTASPYNNKKSCGNNIKKKKRLS